MIPVPLNIVQVHRMLSERHIDIGDLEKITENIKKIAFVSGCGSNLVGVGKLSS